MVRQTTRSGRRRDVCRVPSRDVVLTRQREADFADRTLGQSSPQRAAQHNAGGAVLLKDWFKIGDVDW